MNDSSLTKSRFITRVWIRRRFLVPLLVVLSVKLVVGFFLYFYLGMSSSGTYWMTVDPGLEGQNEALRAVAKTAPRWTYLFLGWDSAWYLSIVEKGYAFSNQAYAFFPGLPLFSCILNSILKNPALALVVLSNAAGILWISLYQLLIENHFGRPTAVSSTILFALFPYVFLFTTVAYSEGLFLFSTLGAWLLFSKGKMLSAMLVASAAVISRSPGLLIVLPILIEMLLRNRDEQNLQNHFRRRDFLFLSIPVICFFAWLIYCKVTLNDWFAPFDRSSWNAKYSVLSFIFSAVLGKGTQVFWEVRLDQFWLSSLASALFLIAAPFLIYALVKTSKSLAIYSGAYYILVLAAGSVASVPRFVSFLFPISLILISRLSQTKRSRIITLILCILFSVVSLLLWSSFLNGAFIA